MKLYVLTDDFGDVIGVFDSPNISQEKLESYFGKFEKIEFNNVDESGIQWEMTIKPNNTPWYGKQEQKITMMYFTLNEI